MTSKLPIIAVMERKDRGAVSGMLAVYRERGVVKYEKTLAIPFEQRIPELVKQPGGRERVSAALATSILSAFQHIEKAKMSADQIIELAEGIIDSAEEDQLAIEDVLLFLKDLLLGKMGKVNDKMDMPLFFELFERYRDKRYQTLEALRYEEHLNLKNMGHAPRSSNEITLNQEDDPAVILDLMQTYNSKDGDED
jgi:hypothetical protein